jgi:hypothetical protein
MRSKRVARRRRWNMPRSSTSTPATSRSPARRSRRLRQGAREAQARYRFAHDNVRKFAEAQKKTLTDIEVEIVPGLSQGRRPSRSRPPAATCPAAATAMWPRDHDGDHRQGGRLRGTSPCARRRAPMSEFNPAILYTADICGADKILAMGGVQGVASMAFGLFGVPRRVFSSAPATSSSPKPSASCSAASASTCSPALPTA